ncbi:hypothetical protein [Actinoplanes sp. M2I2]|uniref:hypothetical protein n=1 Tax=Actinoplanes sp. M2I2 TaxID=1734444 RepID=UPI002021C527|nr:hypothetical protein [Actinoplanes sp. M2I2]
MQQAVASAAPPRGGAWALALIQTVVVAAYTHGVIAYLTTDLEYWSEQSPPAWALPAVYATIFGAVVAIPCVVASVLLLKRNDRQALGLPARLLTAACVGSVAMLVVMVSPLGWAIFEWYVA